MLFVHLTHLNTLRVGLGEGHRFNALTREQESSNSSERETERERERESMKFDETRLIWGPEIRRTSFCLRISS